MAELGQALVKIRLMSTHIQRVPQTAQCPQCFYIGLLWQRVSFNHFSQSRTALVEVKGASKRNFIYKYIIYIYIKILKTYSRTITTYTYKYTNIHTYTYKYTHIYKNPESGVRSFSNISRKYKFHKKYIFHEHQ